MGIFLLQLLMKIADRIIGKGLETWVIIQLVTFNLAWMVVLVVPMAVLIAVLMAFGSMAQSNEVTIMKASGISLPRMIAGPFLASIAVALFLVYFNNNILPDANHRAKILMFDISQTKPTLSLRAGVFSQEVTNYSILAREIEQGTNLLRQLTIYDYSNPAKLNIITARRGKFYFSRDLTKMIMELNDGEIHESDASGTTMYRKLRFTKHKIAMNADQFTFQQSNDASRGDRELSARAMMHRVDSLKSLRELHTQDLKKQVASIFSGDRLAKPLPPAVEILTRTRYYSNLLGVVSQHRNLITSAALRVDMLNKEIDKYMVEVHKKYAIPVACVIFILLGAPLGVMTRKGGFGMAGSISLFFFLIYWAFLIGGEKLADRGMLSPLLGMWAANMVMGALGAFLLYRSMKETVNLNFSWLLRFVPKNWRVQERNELENP
jgi:lipopolysaccharide export system permease protein